jgi:post-segregation antitoxin (ccd killing protein)
VKRKKAGRTPYPEGRVALKLTVPPYVAKRLKASGNASAAVKALVDAELARAQDNQNGK